MKSTSRRSALALAGSIAAIVAAPNSQAAILYWDTTTTGLWSTGANWSNNAFSGGTTGTVPAPTDSAVFNQSSVNGAEIVQFNADQQIKGLTFANTGPTLLDNSSAATNNLYITGGGITINAGAGAVTLGDATNILNLQLGAAEAWSNNSSNLFTVVNGIQSGGSGTQFVTIGGSGNTTVSGVIGGGFGTVGVTKAGAGTLTLSAAETYTAATTVNGGTLLLTGSLNGGTGTALNVGGGTFTFSQAGTNTQNMFGLTVNAGASTINNTVSNDTLALSGITRSAAGSTVNFGTTTGAITTNTQNVNGIIGPWATFGSGIGLKYAVGSASGAATTITGLTGTAAATGANLTDTTGVVNYDLAGLGTAAATFSGNTIRSTGGAVTVTGGATSFTVNGLMNAGTGLFTITGGNLTIGASKELVVTNNTQGTTISSIIVNNGANASSVTSAGAGVLTLNAANTYTGTTSLTLGVLNAGIGQNAAISGPLGASGAINFSGGTLQYSSLNSFDYSPRIAAGTSTGAVAIDTNGQAVVFGTALTTAQSGGLTLNDTNATKGKLTLNGVNTYTGATTVTGGTLIVGDAANSGASLAAGSAVAVGGMGVLGGRGTVNGTVAINSGGTISPGNSPGTLTTGSATYYSGGNYTWEINKVDGTQGVDPGWDLHSISGAGSLTVASTSASPFNVNITGLNAANAPGNVVDWNPANSGTWTITAAGTGGITGFAANKFLLNTAAFANNNATLDGSFAIVQTGNNLQLTFTPSGGGLPQGLGIFASDNAAQSAYASNYGGQNGGFGYGAFTILNASGNSGNFVGSSNGNGGGGAGVTNTGGKSFGLYANSGAQVNAIRPITGNLAVGRTFSLDLDNGSVQSGGTDGFALRNSAGQQLFEIYFAGGGTAYQISTGGTNASPTYASTGIGFTDKGLHAELTLTSPTTYFATIYSQGGALSTFSGNLITPSSGTSDIADFRAYNFNAGSGGANDAFFNSPIIVLPTYNGVAAGATAGTFSNGANWAAHAPVNGGSLAFDGTGSTVANDSLTSAFNIAFNATANPATGNTTTNAGAYILTGNALTINGGIDNNSTNLQTINNNLTLGASQSFNATNGALALGGTAALNGKYLTVNAASDVALNGNISGNGDLLKSGSGTLTLSGNNTFSGTGLTGQTYGQVFITNGTVRAASNSALGVQAGGVSVDLGDSNLGQTGVTNYQNNVSLLANSGLTITNQLYVASNTVGGGNATRTIGSDGTTGPVTFSGNVLLAGSAILTAASGGDVTFSGQVGPSGFTAGGITKAGFGKVTLSNATNTYTGTTTVTAGSLKVSGSLNGTTGVVVNNGGSLLLSGASETLGSPNSSAPGSLTNSAPVALGGGSVASTLALTGTAQTEYAGTLTLSQNSTIDLGTSNSNNLHFTSLTLNGTGLAGLAVTHWTGSFYGVSSTTDAGGGTQDHLLFSNDPTEAVASQLSFFDDTGAFIGHGHDVAFGGAGGGFEIVPIPEPSTIYSGLLILGLAGYRERRRLRKLLPGLN